MYDTGMFRIAVAMSAMAAMLAPAFAMEWMTDFDTAKEKAVAENKPLLVDFTGSDWCYYCKVLSEKVLDTPEFAAYAETKFIPVELDFPHSKPVDPKQQERNMEVSRRYDISGFPTVLVLSPQGDILGGFVGGADSLARVQPALDTAVENFKLLEAAKSAAGLERAKAFAKLYSSLPDAVKTKAEAYKKEIVDNDKENVTGLLDVFAAEKEMREIAKELQNAENYDSLISMIDQKLPNVMPANKPQLMLVKSHCMVLLAETEEDIRKAKQMALEAAALIPDAQGAEELRSHVEQQYADTSALLEMAKNARSQRR